MLVLSSGPVAASSGAQSTSLTVQVYADGSAYVSQRLSTNPNATSVSVQLLSSVLSSVVVTDQSGAPLEYAVSETNLTIYTLGASGVLLKYDTLDLTSKKGAVWTVAFVTEYDTTLVLPQFSTLTYASGTPTTLGVNDGYPTATLPAGSWEVSYGVSLGSLTTTVTGSSAGNPWAGLAGIPTWAWAGAVIVVAAAAALLVVQRRKGGRGGSSGADLRPDDVQVLDFIAEKGGKVLEPEIRMKFALPKTSGWRQIKRLERLGYLKVTKVGSQNQIELVKKGKEEA